MSLSFMDCEWGGASRSPPDKGASGGPSASCAREQNSRIVQPSSPLSLVPRALTTVTKAAVYVAAIRSTEDARDTQ